MKDQTSSVLTLPYTQSLPACVWTPAALSAAFYSASSKSANDLANCAFLAPLAVTGCYGFGSAGKQNTRSETLGMNACLVQSYLMTKGPKKGNCTERRFKKMVLRCRSSLNINLLNHERVNTQDTGQC